MPPSNSEHLTNSHLNWLVKQRARKQQSAYDLHVIMTDQFGSVKYNERTRFIMSELVAINFSLWRAVFLSDIAEGTDDIVLHAQSFLKNLVVNNAVAYPQDRDAKEWTFTYYMHNSQYRLENIAKNFSHILPNSEFMNSEGPSDKLWWEECQQSLESCILNYKVYLEDIEGSSSEHH